MHFSLSKRKKKRDETQKEYEEQKKQFLQQKEFKQKEQRETEKRREIEGLKDEVKELPNREIRHTVDHLSSKSFSDFTAATSDDSE